MSTIKQEKLLPPKAILPRNAVFRAMRDYLLAPGDHVSFRGERASISTIAYRNAKKLNLNIRVIRDKGEERLYHIWRML